MSLKVVPKSRCSDRGEVVPVLRDQRSVEAERLTPLVQRLLVELPAERCGHRVARGHAQDEEDEREDHPDHRDHQQDALQDVPGKRSRSSTGHEEGLLARLVGRDRSGLSPRPCALVPGGAQPFLVTSQNRKMNDGSSVLSTPDMPLPYTAVFWPDPRRDERNVLRRDVLQLPEDLLALGLVVAALLLGDQLVRLRVLVAVLEEAAVDHERRQVVVGVRVVREPAQEEQVVGALLVDGLVLLPLGALQGDLEQSARLELALDLVRLVLGARPVVGGRPSHGEAAPGVLMPASWRICLALAVSGAPYASLKESFWPP